MVPWITLNASGGPTGMSLRPRSDLIRDTGPIKSGFGPSLMGPLGTPNLQLLDLGLI